MQSLTYNPFDNPEFRKELSAMFDEKVRPIMAKVDEHERTIQRQRGAVSLVVWLTGAWTLLTCAAEYMFHKR